MENEDNLFAARNKVLITKQAEAEIALKLAKYRSEQAQLELERIEHGLRPRRALPSEEDQEERDLQRAKRPRRDCEPLDSVSSHQQEDRQQRDSIVEQGHQPNLEQSPATIATQPSPRHHPIPTSAAGRHTETSDQNTGRAEQDGQNSQGCKSSTTLQREGGVLPNWTVPTLAFQAQQNAQPDPSLVNAAQQQESKRNKADPRLRRQSLLRFDGSNTTRRPSSDGADDGEEELSDGRAAAERGRAKDAAHRRRSHIPDQALYRPPPPPTFVSVTDLVRRPLQSNAATHVSRRSPALELGPLASIPTPQADEDKPPHVDRKTPKWAGPPKPALRAPSPPRRSHRQETFQRFAHALLSRLQRELNDHHGLRNPDFFQHIRQRFDARTFDDDDFGLLADDIWERVHMFRRGDQRVDGMVQWVLNRAEELLGGCLLDCRECEERDGGLDERRQEVIVGLWVKRVSELRV
ncbi:hypothetical protein LTR99_000158 [Exophiala xenobiotica]|uniref:Uncharacterized protein n=1 Tax=Vermiconidia calcicola TaxID=1690605 RepID=A0AAV9PUV3_9PEZI|nr:hypothetical protein LTR92_009108 [Exophiala xenobiotica]KAK5530035.1 hypothetical protein LTR25_009279 [Vermiconidia calcicola]KAK5547354.1 hypothetical protein LTR23_002574 [Chaetothyriales sp. CCFEE 6169]KAK5265433.1 hypothetical protein LTR96_009337 [Exophiala xenobiotica]KAK5307188.1 hypothetical protein LTR99_000158 [Exophiala xenobiotica]